MVKVTAAYGLASVGASRSSLCLCPIILATSSKPRLETMLSPRTCFLDSTTWQYKV